MKKGRDPITKQYCIPVDLQAVEDILRDQLELLEQISGVKPIVNQESKDQISAPKERHSSVSRPTNNPVDVDDQPSTSKRARPTVKDNVLLPKKIELVQAGQGGFHRLKDYNTVLEEKGKMAQKLRKAAPYNLFLTAIADSPQTHRDKLSITFIGIG